MTDIRKVIESHKDEMIDCLGELVAIRSVQCKAEEGFPFGKEPAKALELMLKKCEKMGFEVNNAENYVGTADYGEEPQLAILSHLDVVPEGTGWTTESPFKLTLRDGKLIGRGAIDDKGPAVASLYALKAVKELGIPLKSGVRLIFGTNEENGSADLEYYRKNHALPPMVFTPDGEYPVINGEKGMIRVYFSTDLTRNTGVHAGEVINAVPKRCVYDIPIKENNNVALVYGAVEGKSAHASTPEKGENAITKFLSLYGENVPVLFKLSKLFPHGEFNGKSCGLGFRDDISGDMTCVLSMLNTEEGKLKGGIDIRFPLDRKLDEIKSIICGVLEENGFTVDSCEGTEPHFTDENSEFVQSLLKVYEKVTGDKGRCISIGGGTYVHEIEGGVAFGAEFPNEDGHMHSLDEFITVENLLRNTEIIAEAIIEICG